MDREQLKEQLSKPYDRDRWRDVVKDVFPHVAFYEPQEIPCTEDAVDGFAQIGDVRLKDGKVLTLFEVKVADRIQLHRNRVGLRNIVARRIDQATNHGVLVIFDSNSDDYRFTFAAKESELDEDGNLVEQGTATRRYTYVLGPNETCRTAADRFYELSRKRDHASLNDVQEAFSVDKLNKEFFSAYKQHYEKFASYLINSEYRKSVFDVGKITDGKERAAAEKPLRDFAKRLLGRIVFLHFIQKKGWLGCPSDRKQWTDGNPNFLADLFEHCSDKEHFHSGCLIPLFHGALNTPGRQNDIFELTGSRIPYLNGGLFESDDPDVTGVDFPEELFADLLEFFGQYNFTIDENDPEDHEVGIDPEMLGHIFENLLEDNKDKGAYYTPKAIVQYMCQESLIQYLKTHLGDHDELEQLVRLKTRGDEQDKNNYIVQNAREIEKLLDNVKICDPAIGSGAFPIGLLYEIYWIKLTLDLTLDRAEVKRQIIQNSIYGVDIDAGAVEIARLRFWLALVVDEEEPSPLPNLDYKIMQGNSLLESFEGIPLHSLTEGEQISVQVLGSKQNEFNLGAIDNEFRVQVDEERRKNIIALMDRYFSETKPEEKARIHAEIDRFVLDHIDHNIALHKERLEIELHQLKTEIKSKQKRAKGYKPSKKEEKRLATLQAEIEADAVRKKKLHELERKPERPFFLWHLYFQNVFDDGGFDIVIANPPYVRQEVIRDQKPALQAAYDCYVGTADLFVYFYERSAKLLRDGGVLTYITSNRYYRSAYGKKLREFLAKKLRIRQMIDFGDAPVFDAIAYASIFIGDRTDVVPPDHDVRAYTWAKDDKLSEIGKVVRSQGFAVAQSELQPEAWRLESPVVMRLLEKLKATGTPLGEYVGGKFYRGVLTGLNEAFVVERATRDRLIKEDPKSKEVFVPFLRGRDVKRWRVDFADYYLIKIESSENKEHPWSGKKDAEAIFKKTYPAIYAWMKPFREGLVKRWDQGKYFWELRSCAYYEEFTKPALIFPDIAKRSEFSYSAKNYYLINTMYLMPTDKVWLAALLNSDVILWFYLRLSNLIRGGFVRFIAQYIEQIPIPNASEDAEADLGELVFQAQRVTGKELLDIESEINQRVYQLFNLTPAEIELVDSSLAGDTQAADVKSDLRSVLLEELKQMAPYFSMDAVRRLLDEKGLEITNGTLRHYMSDAMAQGIVHDAGRGWYSGIKEPCKLDPKPVKKIAKLLEKQFPLLDFVCWSTQQINPWMHHILSKFITFVNVEKDGLSAVADVLRSAGYMVHQNPGKNQANEVVPNGKTVVIRPLVGKAPTEEGHLSPPEAVLVDLFMENKALNIMGKADFHEMLEALASTSRLSWGSMLYYASEREIPLGELIGDNSALTRK